MNLSGQTDSLPPDQQSHPEAMRLILETARRFVAVHEQAAALTALTAPPPLSHAEGIERDLLAFRMERAARELREALRAIDTMSSGRVGPAGPGA